MRRVLSTAVFAFLLTTYADAQTSTEGLSCFANLGTPEYPTAALQAHVDGSVWTTTHVSPQGTNRQNRYSGCLRLGRGFETAYAAGRKSAPLG
jgi:hypothetical protein